MIQRSRLILFSLCLLSLFGTSCRWGEKAMPQKEELFLVNVLDKKFYEDCTIVDKNRVAKSINVTMDDLETYAQNNWDKKLSHIVVFCANYKCTASGESAKMLKDQGFKNVWAFEGGTAEWKHLGYPVSGPCTQGYLNDYEKPEGDEPEADVPVITAQELKAKIEKFSSN